MLHSSGPPPFITTDGFWLAIGGKQIPLMAIDYAGSAKAYLLLLPYAVLGSGPVVSRLVTAGVTALGLLGVGLLVRHQISPRLAVVTVLLLAMNPSFVSFSLYDSTGMALFFGVSGLSAWLLSRYLHNPGFRAAFLLGVALGLGIWIRANFLWIIVSVSCAVLIVTPRLVSSRWRHAFSIAGGAVIGGFPFLLYQVISRGGTLRVSGNLEKLNPLADLLPRIYLFTESLFFPRERLWIWNGPALPSWQQWIIAGTVLVALGVCLFDTSNDERAKWRRGAGLALLIGLAITTASTLPIKAHHYAGLLPIVAFVATLAADRVIRWRRSASVVVIVLAVLYSVNSIGWNFFAGSELRRTGGTGRWSDAINDVTAYLVTTPQREVTILDWGLANNLYVLSSGRIRFENLSTAEHLTESDWIAIVQRGGLFLTNAPENRNFHAVPGAFERALQLSGESHTRRTFFQGNGTPYADIYEVPGPDV